MIKLRAERLSAHVPVKRVAISIPPTFAVAASFLLVYYIICINHEKETKNSIR